MAVYESQGTKLFWVPSTSFSTFTTVTDTGSTMSANLIGQVVAFNGPSGSAAKIDITDLASTGKEYLMGIRDEGDISLDVLYDPSDTAQTAMFTDRGTRAQRGWIIKLSTNNERLGGLGYCTGFSVTGSVDDAVKATLGIAITGAIKQTTGTSLL